MTCLHAKQGWDTLGVWSLCGLSGAVEVVDS
jgi:hypothetical protein